MYLSKLKVVGYKIKKKYIAYMHIFRPATTTVSYSQA